jgi:hypothetical protein
VGHDCAFIELTLRGRPVACRVCERTTLRDELVIERESYFNPTPRAILTSPTGLAGARPRTAATAASRTKGADEQLAAYPMRKPAMEM